MITAGITTLAAGAVVALWNLSEGSGVLFCMANALGILGTALFGVAMLLGGAA